MYVKGTLLKGINIDIAYEASASVWFRSNERPRTISGFGRTKNGTRASRRTSPLFYSRLVSRSFRLSFLVICSETAGKGLLRRLVSAELSKPFNRGS